VIVVGDSSNDEGQVMPSGVLAFRLSMVAILFFALCVVSLGFEETFSAPFRVDALVDRVVPGDRTATIKVFVELERTSAQRERYIHYALVAIMLGSAVAGLYGSYVWWPLSARRVDATPVLLPSCDTNRLAMAARQPIDDR